MRALYNSTYLKRELNHFPVCFQMGSLGEANLILNKRHLQAVVSNGTDERILDSY